MAGQAVKTLTIGGITGEVFNVQLGAPSQAEPIDITTLADEAHEYVPNIKSAGPLSMDVTGLAVVAGDAATLTLTGATTGEGGVAGDAISVSIAGWISSAEPSTVDVDGERRVSVSCQFHPYSAE
jgi:hypothetical protein